MYGTEIKNARMTNGATQTQVAKATGLPQNTISWIELNKGIPNIQQCVILADFYGITLDELIGRDVYETKTNPKYHIGTINNSNINMK